MREKVQIKLEIKGCSLDEMAFIELAVRERLDEVMEFLEFKSESVVFGKGEQ